MTRGKGHFDSAVAHRLKEYREAARELQAPARVEVVLIAAFREGQWRKRKGLELGRWRLWAAAAGLAAAGLAIAGGAAWMRKWEQIEPPAAVERIPAPAPEVLWARKSPSAPAAPLSTAPRRRRTDPGREFQPQREAESAATEFIAVTHPATWPDSETRQLLRVRMPRMAAAALGIPVNVERADEMIRADVMVGQDGVVRAIRFVH